MDYFCEAPLYGQTIFTVTGEWKLEVDPADQNFQDQNSGEGFKFISTDQYIGLLLQLFHSHGKKPLPWLRKKAVRGGGGLGTRPGTGLPLIPQS